MTNDEIITYLHKLREDISSLIEQLQQNPQQDIRPVGWSARSTASYYNKRGARLVRGILDIMVSSGQNYSISNVREQYMVAPRTFILKLTQGCLYLNEHLDPTGAYARLRDQIEIQRIDRIGIEIIWKKQGGKT